MKNFLDLLSEYPYTFLIICFVTGCLIADCKETICIHKHGSWRNDSCHFERAQ